MAWIRRLIYAWHEAEIERLQRRITQLLQREATIRNKFAEAHRLVLQITEDMR